MKRPVPVLIALLAAGLSVYQLWQPIVGFLPPGALPLESLLGLQPATYLRPVYLGWVLALGYLIYPLKSLRWLDYLILLLVLWASYRILSFDYQSIEHLLHGLDGADLAAGLILIAATLEMARRSVGLVMMLIGLVFTLYGLFGNLLPDALSSRGFPLERLVRFQVFTNAGIFGAPLGIAAGAVFSFILFGAFLQVTGAGKFMIDLSFALAGRYRGGPAKASVIASAAMGSISGSAIANTVTTGALTIPMMKRIGFRPHQAAGIEAAASTGGQIMPPIMGAGAFVMAEFTRTPYGDIVWMSVVPALLYFAAVLLYVHILSLKSNLTGMEKTGSTWQLLRDGIHFLLPLAVITLLLVENYSPTLVGAVGCAAVVLTGLLRSHTRVGLRLIFQALRQGALLAVPVSVACAVAGLVVGTIGQTGIGLQFTESLVSLSQGQLWLALILVAAAALILGMGLPATAAYIVLAVMTGSALQELGLALVTAHLIIFWLAQTSNVTPPIALAAFAGAGIAGAPPMRSAIEALRLASGLFLIPLMMAYTPLILTPETSWMDLLLAALTTLGLIVSVAVLSTGYLLAPAGPGQKLAAALATGLLIFPSVASRLAGLLLVVLLVVWNLQRSWQDKEAAAG